MVKLLFQFRHPSDFIIVHWSYRAGNKKKVEKHENVSESSEAIVPGVPQRKQERKQE